MRAKELMDKNFVYLNSEDSVVEVSKVMEKVLLLQKIVVEKRSNLKNNNC